jgi:hypothetical protein
MNRQNYAVEYGTQLLIIIQGWNNKIELITINTRFNSYLNPGVWELPADVPVECRQGNMLDLFS